LTAGAEIARRVGRAVERACGRRPSGLVPLVGGLAARLFFRVHLPGGEPETLVARVEMPEDPSLRPAGAPPEPALEPLRTRLEAAGLPVPRRYGGEEGIDLLEDLGDVSLCALASGRAPAERRDLYREALALLPPLQRIRDPELPAFARRLDARLIAYKADLFCTWSLPAVLGRPARPAEAKLVAEAFARIADRVAEAPLLLAHRDFQSRNLLWHARAGEPARPFLIDLQGAFLAPPEYDAVCLLCDSYLETPAEERAALAAWLRPRLPDPPAGEDFEARFDLLTLVRKAKDHARYLQACAAGRDPGYLGAALGAAARCLRETAPRAARLDAGLADLAQLLLALPDPSDPDARPCAP
jgi:aminoglycoside/choline kinase family phosphotransferase